MYSERIAITENTYNELLGKGVPGLSMETQTVYYLDKGANIESTAVLVQDRPSRKLKNRYRKPTDKLSLEPNWEYATFSMNAEEQKFIRAVHTFLVNCGGSAFSKSIRNNLRYSTLANETLLPQQIGHRIGTLIKQNLLIVNAPPAPVLKSVPKPVCTADLFKMSPSDAATELSRRSLDT